MHRPQTSERVFFIEDNLTDRLIGPTTIGMVVANMENGEIIQLARYPEETPLLLGVKTKDFFNNFDFLRRAGNDDRTVCPETFSLTQVQLLLWGLSIRYQHPPKTIFWHGSGPQTVRL